MATRTITTSPPVLSCDVCERRLLRGEHHEVFLHAGQRLTVCELCAPRAAAEGWVRERDHVAEGSALPRQRQARGLFARLRGSGSARARTSPDEEQPFQPPVDEAAQALPASLHEQPYEAERAAVSQAGFETASEPHASDREELLLAGVAVFNESAFPRRMAGLARSLGTPSVYVHVAEHLASAVRIVIAWELCWYRYEVDLSEQPAVTRALEQGSELEQLEREERVANALLGESGKVALAAHA